MQCPFLWHCIVISNTSYLLAPQEEPQDVGLFSDPQDEPQAVPLFLSSSAHPFIIPIHLLFVTD
jgi:hypothetical protein